METKEGDAERQFRKGGEAERTEAEMAATATAAAKIDPRRWQADRSDAGEAWRRVTKAEVLARLWGCSTRYVRMILAGDRPDALAVVGARLEAAVAAGFSPAPVFTYLHTRSRGGLQHMSQDELAKHTRRLMLAETVAQGKLDPIQMQFDPDDPEKLDELEQYAEEQVDILLDILAAVRELKRRHAGKLRTNGRNGRAGR